MLWVNLLHFYQPYNQQKDILNRVVNECYLPLLRGFTAKPGSKLVVNINGALTRLLLDSGYGEVVGLLKNLLDAGQIEMTGSAMYHAFLPLLTEEEIERQITLNFEENRKSFGEKYAPLGFFSPEMAVSDKLLKVVSKMGFRWVFASDTAKVDTEHDIASNIFEDPESGIKVFFRNKRISSLVLSGWVRSSADMLTETTDIYNKDKYWLSVMDAETFGHHRIGHQNFLFELYDSGRFNFAHIADVMGQKDLPVVQTKIRPCTWTNEEQDFWIDREKKVENTKANSFMLWKDPSNPIHVLQWEFLDFITEKVNNSANKNAEEWKKARFLLDMAEASDQFWWASAKPWWSLEMIESGAYDMKQVMNTLYKFPDGSAEIARAEVLYRKILDKAFEWQRTGYIRQKHLQNSSTYLKAPFKERAPAEWYNQIVLEFEDEIKKCAASQDFEKAIKWRDALTKLRAGTDIYDILHVVDELWTVRRIPVVKPFLTHEWEEFSTYAKENFRDARDKNEFEAWKKNKQSGILS